MFIVPGFLNTIPTIEEWGDCLPRFKENKDDLIIEHLLNFHELMHQLGIVHEDTIRRTPCNSGFYGTSLKQYPLYVYCRGS